MPYVNGVFQLLPGSYGAPNTPVKSAPYNAQLDDFTNAQNSARPVAAGGTGATNTTDAREKLGLKIGTNVQAYDALLQAIAALTTSADKLIYTTGADTVALTTLSAFGRTLIDDSSATVARATLGLTIGTNVQAYDDLLLAIAGLTTSADKVIMTTGTDTVALKSIGTSGDAIPLLNTANTWSGQQFFTDGIRIGGGSVGVQWSNDDFLSYDDSTNAYTFTSDGSVPGTILNSGKIRLTDTTDASLTSTAHAFQIGPDTGQNLIIDNNELQSRSNGAGADLNINIDGGNVNIGNTAGGSAIDLRGTVTTGGAITAAGNVDATGGLISRGSGPYLKLIDTTSAELSGRLRVNANNMYMESSSNDVDFLEVFRFELDTKRGYIDGKRIYANGAGFPVTIPDGGSGATTAAGARTAFGLGGLATLDVTDLYYTGTSNTNASYPVSSYVLADPGDPGSGPARNSTVSVWLTSGNNFSFTTVSAAGSTQLTGTWRARGWYNGNGSDLILLQRV